MDPTHRSLSDSLKELLALPGDRLSVRTIADQVGDKGFGLMLAILSLPSALPVPAPGYSTPFGILLVLLGTQLLVGRPRPWLPERALRKEVSKEFAGKIFGAATQLLKWTERLIRPRMQWINSTAGRTFLGGIVIFMAALMILPIPMTNTFPAMVIFLIGVSLSEDDGLAAIFAFLIGLTAAAFYFYILYLLATLGVDGVLELKEWIKGLVRS
ncbi:MAG: exopolysaccharide biosynthesis protein [Verrucomicrobiota bacterium]